MGGPNASPKQRVGAAQHPATSLTWACACGHPPCRFDASSLTNTHTYAPVRPPRVQHCRARAATSLLQNTTDSLPARLTGAGCVLFSLPFFFHFAPHQSNYCAFPRICNQQQASKQLLAGATDRRRNGHAPLGGDSKRPVALSRAAAQRSPRRPPFPCHARHCRGSQVPVGAIGGDSSLRPGAAGGARQSPGRCRWRTAASSWRVLLHVLLFLHVLLLLLSFLPDIASVLLVLLLAVVVLLLVFKRPASVAASADKRWLRRYPSQPGPRSRLMRAPTALVPWSATQVSQWWAGTSQNSTRGGGARMQAAPRRWWWRQWQQCQ